MTQVITRYFESAQQAQEAKYELTKINRLSHRILETYDSASGLVEKLVANNVADATARAYADRMAKGGVVMLVRAGAKPLGVARITRDVTAKFGAVDMGRLSEEVYVKEEVRLGLSVLESHPHMLSITRDASSGNYHMADWPIPLISRRAPGASALMPGGPRMANFPISLLKDIKPFTASIFPRHARMANFPFGLISRRKPFKGTIFPRHARMASFPIRLISRRKPRNRSAIPRHGRMATVPFPLLINGKTGSNALIPGAPRMANFPISLLSKRKPFTGTIFKRHARMASFPIGLTSGRKPFTGSIISRHGRMADMFLPLIVRREDVASRDGGSGYSFSKKLGMPTLTRR